MAERNSGKSYLKFPKSKVFVKVWVILFTLCFSYQSLKAQIFTAAKTQIEPQTSIKGIVNYYSKVLNTVGPGTDSVKVSDIDSFNVGDAVLIIQMKAVVSYIPDTFGLRANSDNLKSAGNYEIVRIKSKNVANSFIKFTTPLTVNLAHLDFFYDTAGMVQLIRVPIYESVTVDTAGITCPPWDSKTGIGGILAFFVINQLTLKGNIDVSGKGFAGADPGSENYTGTCANGSNAYDSLNYAGSSMNRSGYKGEGVAIYDPSLAKGRGFVISSPGGGNGRFSGGGGGGNYAPGGLGASQLCSSGKTLGGNGGFSLSLMYNLYQCIYLGSGGGAGTQDRTDSLKASKGGNGGGIAIIIANKIVSVNHAGIYANGMDADTTIKNCATAGAGGGGGGGVILIDADYFLNTIIAETKGGIGGFVRPKIVGAETIIGGPGGGGGAGLIWYRSVQPNFDPELYHTDGGSAGINVESTSSYDATSGTGQSALSTATIHLNGFLFNYLPDGDTICKYSTSIKKIIGSAPKGGDNTYNWQWLVSTDNIAYHPATALSLSSALKDFQPPDSISSLYDSVFYKRVVFSGLDPDFGTYSFIDTSLQYVIRFFPPIKRNVITSPDTTLCYNGTPAPISAKSVTGGTGYFSYYWKLASDTTRFLAGDTLSMDSLYTPDQKLVSQTSDSFYYYRRFVTSGGCTSGSTMLKVKILPRIKGNVLVSDQTLCQNIPPIILHSNSAVLGGVSSDHRKIWEKSINGTSWSFADSANLDYSPGGLQTTTHFRRIIISGPYDVCKDTSNVLLITVLPPITNNKINTADNTICSGFAPLPIRTEKPSGGDTISKLYTYTWFYSTDNIKWYKFYPPHNDTTGFAPGTLDSTTWFRRKVVSGIGDACKDSANSIKITVDPRITNNLISKGEIICQGGTPLNPFESLDTVPTGGAGPNSYFYKWEQSNIDTLHWQPATQNPNDSFRLSPVPLQSDMFYRRIVNSGACSDTMQNPYRPRLFIKVYPKIGNNSQLISDTTICYGTSPKPFNIIGSPYGGNVSFKYSWYYGSDSVSMFLLSGDTLKTYDPGALTTPVFFRRKVVSGPCQSFTKALTLKIYQLPVGSLSGPIDTSICDNGRIQNIRISMTGGKAPWDVYVSNSLKVLNISSPGILVEKTFTPVSGQKLPFTFTIDSLIDANHCLATSKSGSFTSTVYSLPVSSSLQLRELACGNQKALSGNMPVYANGTWTILGSQNASIADVHKMNSLITNKTLGSNVLLDSTSLKWHVYNWDTTCSVTNYGKVIFYDIPKPRILVPAINYNHFNDTTVYNADISTLKADTVVYPNSGKWSVGSSGTNLHFTQDNMPTTLLQGLLQNGAAKTWVYWTVQNAGCMDTIYADSARVTYSAIHPYSGFSPGFGFIGTDGKSYDEIYWIEGIEDEADFKLTIISSWNTVVYKYQGPGNQWKGWDGKGNQIDNDGNEMPQGTYYYILELKDRNLTGPILLRRKK